MTVVTNVVREYEKIAEAESLRVVEVIRRSRHTFMVLENKNGDQMWQPVHNTNVSTGRDKKNATAQFRRFSRGETHGLRVVRYGE
jgi:hypothetical protein